MSMSQEFGEDFDEWTRIVAERANDGLATDF